MPQAQPSSFATPPSHPRRDGVASAPAIFPRRPSAVPPLIRYPQDLPITARRDEIVAAIRGHQVVVLAGETGSGKTTQLPKMCLEALPDAPGKIGCTQPRRVAAMSVSKRVAEELGVAWGREVGCKMRFNDDTSRETRVKFMTDGILLAEIQSDPLLRGYSALILDEAHERSLNIDFLLGYLQRLLPQRPDLKLLITSATIDTEAFSRAFGDAPIIEVSGRLFPVDIRYRPLGSFTGEDEDDVHYLDAAVEAVEDALIETSDGDVLVFMPTERDIRDAKEMLEGRLGRSAEVLTLFGRMPAAEQQRVFAPGPKRRVVIATNVAETSVTIPRISCVVDTGLARLSRYNPRTRTKRLPVEDISQSSANQRAGRAGRVRDGLCIRLYAADDFEKRPRFTQPEIQRANLAEVILRMKAFRLGEIEDFPFIDPPSHAAIRGGYALLHELGALGETHDMTSLGRELARLPVDPTLGRMLLQARREKALPEMLVIAAGLSIPDPRERPENAKELANAAHKKFAAPDSDFLSLLRIWLAMPEHETGPSRNALRKFCKANFLSLTRVREWRDIWRQLRDALDDEGEPMPLLEDRTAADDAAVHRSILAGLLGHIATRHERNLYKASGAREVTLFPGSGLYERREKNAPKGQEKKSRQPQWIVAGEIVQTSQLFARMVAKIDPLWVAELGEHLCVYRCSEPHWHARTGRVLVWERTLVHGLEVRRQQIDFGKVDPAAATELFIRHALIEGDCELKQPFFLHNQKLREKIETSLTRVRSNWVYALEDLLFRFYAARLENVSSVHDLNRLLAAKGQGFLQATEDDLTAGNAVQEDLALFPDEVALGNTVLPVTYAYQPGEEHDGVTVQVPLPVAESLTSGQLQWLVPGLREEQIGILLRALPKPQRRALWPLEDKIRDVAREFDPGRGEFLDSLATFLTKKYRIDIKATDWPPQSLPTHLRPRVEVIDHKNATVVAARDLEEVRRAVKKTEVRSDAWDRAVQRTEHYGVTAWTFGDLPESLVIEHIAGAPRLGWPGLALREGEVDVRLFKRREEIVEATPAGLRKLGELALGRDAAWAAKELRSLGQKSAPVKKAASFAEAFAHVKTTAPAKITADIPQTALDHILRHLLQLDPLFPLTEARFRAMCDRARKELPAVAHKVRELTAQLFATRDKIRAGKHRYPGLDADLDRLVPDDVLARTPHAQLLHLPRYLRAIEIRAERASFNPAKDAEKAKLLEPWQDWPHRVPAANREPFRWLLEEYRVAIFAQELGTAQPVSPKRLEALLAG